MGHVVSRQPWGVIDVNTTEGYVFFQQDWYYTWLLFNATVRPWTIEEKRHFHNALDRQIWGTWSNRVRLQIRGATDFCRRFAARGVLVNFDIHWVTHPGHWSVTVRKMPAGSDPTTFISNVDFAGRRIELDSADLASYRATNAAGHRAAGGFYAGPHEFGHTIHDPDEYTARSPNLADTNSIMNVGRRIRPRHLTLIVSTLNTMMPGVEWSAPAVIP
jgi:hypothetical protein